MMSKNYGCDRCKKEFETWSTTGIEIPAPSFFGRKLYLELCAPCLDHLRALVDIFMGNRK